MRDAEQPPRPDPTDRSPTAQNLFLMFLSGGAQTATVGQMWLHKRSHSGFPTGRCFSLLLLFFISSFCAGCWQQRASTAPVTTAATTMRWAALIGKHNNMNASEHFSSARPRTHTEPLVVGRGKHSTLEHARWCGLQVTLWRAAKKCNFEIGKNTDVFFVRGVVIGPLRLLLCPVLCDWRVQCFYVQATKPARDGRCPRVFMRFL